MSIRWYSVGGDILEYECHWWSIYYFGMGHTLKASNFEINIRTCHMETKIF